MRVPITLVLLVSICGCTKQTEKMKDPVVAPSLEWSDKEIFVPVDDLPEFDKMSSFQRDREISYKQKNLLLSDEMYEIEYALKGVGTTYSESVLTSQKRWRFEFSKCNSAQCSHIMLRARILYLDGVLDKLKQSVKVDMVKSNG